MQTVSSYGKINMSDWVQRALVSAGFFSYQGKEHRGLNVSNPYIWVWKHTRRETGVRREGGGIPCEFGVTYSGNC